MLKLFDGGNLLVLLAPLILEVNYIANLVKANNSKIPVHHRDDWIHMPKLSVVGNILC